MLYYICKENKIANKQCILTGGKIMKKTAIRIELVPSKKYLDRLETIPREKITCEVIGEMNTGTKIWADIATGEQYFLTRMCGVYAFYKE
jgi:hypothetical protein